MDPLKFRKFKIGDLIQQTVLNPTSKQNVHRTGIIVSVNRESATIEWMNLESIDRLDDTGKIVLLNASLRRMVMSGHLKHFPGSDNS